MCNDLANGTRPPPIGLRRLLQFRIRTLLLATLVFALGLAWKYGGPRPRIGAPIEWDVRTGKNVKWSVPLNLSYTSPVVSGGKVFVGTNNREGYLKRYPPDVDLGALLCFRAEDGKFLWQASSPKLGNRTYDHPYYGVESAPLVERDRLWYVTNRCEVVCLDTEGFYDDQNDGPEQSERYARDEADVIWTLDMFGTLGVRPHEHSPCSPAADATRLFVVTGNGVAMSHDHVNAPDAPSFLALDKKTGKVLWSDDSPGTNIMHGQWGSPVYAELGGVPQVIFPGGDGWVYSFDPEGTPQGNSKLLWKFDINPKHAQYDLVLGTKNEQSLGISIYKGRVYITCGQDYEHGDGPGHLWCVDPTKRGDVSAELVFNRADPQTPVPPRRLLAVDATAGDYVVPNPNSGVVWHYDQFDLDRDGAISFKESMHRTMGRAAIQDDILIAADFSGIVHCLNVASGRVYWTYDMQASCWCSPITSGQHAYVCDEEGDVSIFRLPTESARIETGVPLVGVIESPFPVYAAPTAVGRVLYLNARGRLSAIAEGRKSE